MQLRKIASKLLVVSALSTVFPVLAQEVEPKPTCNHSSALYSS